MWTGISRMTKFQSLLVSNERVHIFYYLICAQLWKNGENDDLGMILIKYIAAVSGSVSVSWSWADSGRIVGGAWVVLYTISLHRMLI